MSCPFQSFRIHSAFLFVLCNVVLLTFNIALGFKYVAPFYGNWNHHPLQVGSSWCHGQLGLDHRVSMAYSAIRRKQQQRWWFELLLVEKCGILNSSGWRNCHYNDGHVSRKHEEKRRNISNRRFRFPYPPFTRGGCIESCSAMHHRQRVNPTAISWEQHHDGGDLAWKNTSVVAIEFQNISGGVMLFNSLSDASYNSTAKNNPFITLCYDVGGLGRSSLSPPSNNMGNTADNFSLNLGKLLDSLPEDTRLIFSRKPDLNQFSDNITLIDYKGRTILRGLHFYKIFCCFLRFIGRVPGIDPLVIIEKVSIYSSQHTHAVAVALLIYATRERQRMLLPVPDFLLEFFRLCTRSTSINWRTVLTFKWL